MIWISWLSRCPEVEYASDYRSVVSSTCIDRVRLTKPLGLRQVAFVAENRGSALVVLVARSLPSRKSRTRRVDKGKSGQALKLR
jgi:hypothetical protein